MGLFCAQGQRSDWGDGYLPGSVHKNLQRRGAPRREALAKEISIATSWGARQTPEIRHLQEQVGTEHPMDRAEEGAGGSAEAEQVPAPNPALKIAINISLMVFSPSPAMAMTPMTHTRHFWCFTNGSGGPVAREKTPM